MAADQQENVQFLQLIEVYPCLYDYTCKNYSNNISTEKAWQEIAAECKLTGEYKYFNFYK